MKRIRKLFFLIVILSLLVNHPLSVMANSNNTSNNENDNYSVIP